MTAPVIDIEPILAPIPGDNPCGEDLRYEAIYDEIKNLRKEGDTDMLEASDVKADWPKLVATTCEVLAGRSKDLQLAAWLTEGAVRVYGFAGLRDGLKVIIGLLENFWDNLYPEIDDGDLGLRNAPLNWLTEADRGARLSFRICEVPLCPSYGEEVFNWNYFNARNIPPRGPKEEQADFEARKAEGEEKAKKFEAAVAGQNLEYFLELRADLTEALDALRRLDAVMDEKFGREAAGITSPRKAIEEQVMVLLNRIIREKGGDAPPAPDGEAAGGNGSAQRAMVPAGGGGGPAGPIVNREDALRRLTELAEFFRITEPNSPLSAAISRAVELGRMPFDRLFLELVEDEAARAQIRKMFGIKAEG
jgi:type VI secretion system protein ImpA